MAALVGEAKEERKALASCVARASRASCLGASGTGQALKMPPRPHKKKKATTTPLRAPRNYALQGPVVLDGQNRLGGCQELGVDASFFGLPSSFKPRGPP